MKAHIKRMVEMSKAFRAVGDNRRAIECQRIARELRKAMRDMNRVDSAYERRFC